MTARVRTPRTTPLPPPPGEVEFLYGSDPVTGELTPEPVAARGAVSVPINRLGEYLEAYGLAPDVDREGGPLQELAGMGWTLFVKRVDGKN